MPDDEPTVEDLRKVLQDSINRALNRLHEIDNDVNPDN